MNFWNGHGKSPSFPSRERGLKHHPGTSLPDLLSSFPSRERGLKQTSRLAGASCWGSFPSRERGLKLRWRLPPVCTAGVVPLAGTWIETAYLRQHPSDLLRSFPSRERGLKPEGHRPILSVNMSFPSRERGLKPGTAQPFLTDQVSFPSRERGLKLSFPRIQDQRSSVVPLAGTWIETPPSL